MSGGKIAPRLALLMQEMIAIKDKLAKLQDLIDKAEKKEGGSPP